MKLKEPRVRIAARFPWGSMPRTTNSRSSGPLPRSTSGSSGSSFPGSSPPRTPAARMFRPGGSGDEEIIVLPDMDIEQPIPQPGTMFRPAGSKETITIPNMDVEDGNGWILLNCLSDALCIDEDEYRRSVLELWNYTEVATGRMVSSLSLVFLFINFIMQASVRFHYLQERSSLSESVWSTSSPIIRARTIFDRRGKKIAEDQASLGV